MKNVLVRLTETDLFSQKEKLMASAELDEIIKRVETLPPDEQLYLISYLAEKARQAYQALPMRPQWRDLQGAAPYPLLGEDAQEWVSRTRRESDQERAQWREGTP